MSRIASLINQLGGSTAIGRKLGTTPQVVNNWRLYGFVPHCWHTPLLKIATEAGVDATRDELERRHKPFRVRTDKKRRAA